MKYRKATLEAEKEHEVLEEKTDLLKKDLEKIRKIVKEKELNWRSFQNNPEGAAVKISTTWAVKGWPTLVVIDETGHIRYRGHNGNQAIEKAKAWIEEKREGSEVFPWRVEAAARPILILSRRWMTSEASLRAPKGEKRAMGSFAARTWGG